MSHEQGTVLIVEDDVAVRRSLQITLSSLGFRIWDVSSAEEALARLREADFDAVLMDLNLPGMSGIEACRRARCDYPQLPILIVSARDTEEDKIEALDAGADDYVTKPLKIGELTARIRAAVRRKRILLATPAQNLLVGIYELQAAPRLVTKRGKNIPLTPTEFYLLAFLMKNAGRPIPHARLLSTVWGAEYADQREYLRTYILQLRRKLEDDPSKPAYLRTVNALGYVFHNPSEDEERKG